MANVLGAQNHAGWGEREEKVVRSGSEDWANTQLLRSSLFISCF